MKETKENSKKTITEEKKYRLLRNPNQTSAVQTYFDVEGKSVMVPKEGYYFSMDKAMDKTIEFLKKEYDFIEVN